MLNSLAVSMTYEQGLENLRRLVQSHAEHITPRNEATTRLHLIDRLLTECLGWELEDITAEEPHGREYADYVLSAPRRVAIVEAKREGEYFELPVGDNRLEWSLRTLRNTYPSLANALAQVSEYCQKRGVPVAWVTNGHQIVAFVAVRSDGVPPLDGRCVVFASLELMIEHFLDLWQSLSKAGCVEGLLSRRLFNEPTPTLPPTLADKIAPYPDVQRRNTLQTDLEILSDLVIEDISRHRELEPRFLSDTYCPSGALSQYALTTKDILAARYSALFASDEPGPTTVPATSKHGLSTELLSESLTRRPILLLGDVGVGKTMFIRRLITIDAADLFADAISLYVDLGSKGILTDNLRSFVLDDITDQLRIRYNVDINERNFVHGVYNLELKRFRHSIWGDLRDTDLDRYQEKELEFLQTKLAVPDAHLRHSLEHLSRARKKQIVIFLDNADQRDENVQERAFLISQELSEHWPAMVFLTLRPETFHHSKKIGTLSGYHPKAFTISPPRVDLVVERRLEFALKITSGEIPVEALGNVALRLNALDDLIRIFLASLQANNQLVTCIDNMSAGNVRLALDLVRQFFGSGHINTQKILDIYHRSGGYRIPLHEFLRAIIYSDTYHWDPSRSSIANMFALRHSDPKEHFSIPICVTAVTNLVTKDGWAETANIYSAVQSLGFMPEQVDAALFRCVEKQLVETSGRRLFQRGTDAPLALRSTTRGAYHLRYLLPMFVYLDAVVIDTPILNASIGNAIRDVRVISERLDRAVLFLDYLDKCWLSVGSSPLGFNWPPISALARSDIENVRKRSLRVRDRGN